MKAGRIICAAAAALSLMLIAAAAEENYLFEKDTVVILHASESGHEGYITDEADVEPGYYTITADVVNKCADAENSVCYVYAEGYIKTSVSVPVTDTPRPVKLAGVGTNGALTVGIYSNGYNDVELTNIRIEKTDKPYKFLQGGDITEVSYIESLGGEYKDTEGNKVDPVEYLSDVGMNLARIRLTNNPGKGRGDGTYYLPEGFQDEADCLSLAKRAKDAGMEIQFTFNYSDYWSNGERQMIPSDWTAQIKNELGYDVSDVSFLKTMTDAQREEITEKLGDILYDYTYDIMTKLKKQGTEPEYVSLGNEINGGLFFPFANTYDAYMDDKSFSLIWDNIDEDKDVKCPMDWDSLAYFLNKGYDAVKSVSPESQVIIHLAEGSKPSVFTWFFDKYEAAGGKYDVIGASYYPAWSGNKTEACAAFCDEIGAKYDKKIMIMESGFNWNRTCKDGYPGQLVDIDDYKDVYPPTKSGHKMFMEDLICTLRTSDYCIGNIYWDPCMIHVEDEKGNNLSGWAYNESDGSVDVNVVENTTLFDFDGKAIPSVKVYSENTYGNIIEDAAYIVISAVYDKDNKLVSAQSEKKELSEIPENGQLKIDKNGNTVKYFIFKL